ncbi:adenosylcobinamide-GDP ribazoletransferase [Jiangella alkaliphila]|uniref:Adenosylcobinamide-GDP ribazoletransferase n=1 Tax=Jiangella alkaliphila TaxID=419479 RepID=A0A1H2HHH8_9ACTN|nr:adenosylcobinamide-GDP ribazoletransferase [Jiangella alkaliphila]SDU31232.1 cobalamin-5'-phosphate synthase [Jiangella alkaliphila]
MIAALRTAVEFLTRIPVGASANARPGLDRAGAWFPLVGALVGAVGLAVWWVADALAGPLVAAVAAVLATVIVTGALHEDGLADTADGLWGGSTRERRLEIMRDSRLGTYGALALAGDLLLRVALLATAGSAAFTDVARVLLAGHVVARAAPLVLAAWLPVARVDGQGQRLGRLRAGDAVVAAVTVLVVAVLVTGWWAPVVLAAAAVPVLGLRRAARRRIGGVTGDVLGAGVALTNLAVAIVVVALAQEDLL